MQHPVNKWCCYEIRLKNNDIEQILLIRKTALALNGLQDKGIFSYHDIFYFERSILENQWQSQIIRNTLASSPIQNMTTAMNPDYRGRLIKHLIKLIIPESWIIAPATDAIIYREAVYQGH